MTIKDSSDVDFEHDVFHSEIPVLVDFWAPWCGPCKFMGPLLEQLATEQTQFNIVKIDVDKNTETMKKFGIRGIPALILFSNGEIKGTKIGALLSKDQILAFVNDRLA